SCASTTATPKFASPPGWPWLSFEGDGALRLLLWLGAALRLRLLFACIALPKIVKQQRSRRQHIFLGEENPVFADHEAMCRQDVVDGLDRGTERNLAQIDIHLAARYPFFARFSRDNAESDAIELLLEVLEHGGKGHSLVVAIDRRVERLANPVG